MQEKRIPLAWTTRWRRIRLHAIPIACFCVAVVACGWLWQRHGPPAQSVGEVDGLRVDVTSPVAGLVVALPHESKGQWSLHDQVAAGDVIARMDDRQLRSDQGLFRQEIKELVDELNQWKAASVEGADTATVQSVDRAWQYEVAQLTSMLQSSLAMPDVEIADLEPPGAPPELPATVSAATSSALMHLRETRQTLATALGGY